MNRILRCHKVDASLTGQKRTVVIGLTHTRHVDEDSTRDRRAARHIDSKLFSCAGRSRIAVCEALL
jgi:hypothetical protein